MDLNESKNDGLIRELGPVSATVLVIANMIGTGIFTTSGFIMAELGSPVSLLLCWVVGGIFALSGALCYGELGAMFPRAGGEYVFLRESFGRLPGFLSGWVSLIVGFSAPIAAASMAFAAYLSSSLPEAFEKGLHFPILECGILKISPVALIGVVVIIVFSAVHAYSLYLGSRVQNFLTFFKIAVICVFVGAGLWGGNGSWENFSLGIGYRPVFSESFAVSLIFTSFAYSGWNAAAYLGGEIRDPSRNIPLSLFSGTALVMVLYILLNVAFIFALPAREMSNIIEVGAASAVALFGVDTGRVFSLAITICLLSVISAMIMAGPRVYYAMARDRIFFHMFSRTTKAHKIPAASILLQAGIAALMVLTASFDKLLMYIGFTLSLFAALTIAGLMLLRFKKATPVTGYRTFGYPVTPLLFIVGNAWIIYYCIRSNPIVSLYGGVTIAAGILAFFLFENLGRET